MALKFLRNRNPKGLDQGAVAGAQANRAGFLTAIGQPARPAQDDYNQAMRDRANGLMTPQEAGQRFNTHSQLAVNDPMSYLRAAGWDVGAGAGVGATARLPAGTRISAGTRQGWWGAGGNDGRRGGLAPNDPEGFIGTSIRAMSDYANARGPAGFRDILGQGYGGQPLGEVDEQGRYTSSLYGQMIGRNLAGGGYNYGASGGGGGRGGTSARAVGNRLQELQNQANADNRARYDQALADERAGAGELMELAAQGGRGATGLVDRRISGELGGANARMAARGLGNSTAGEGVRRGIQLEADLARANIADQTTARMLGVGTRNLDRRLELLQAPTTQLPDTGLYAKLLSRPGAAGGGGGGGYLPNYPQYPMQQIVQGVRRPQLPEQGFAAGPGALNNIRGGGQGAALDWRQPLDIGGGGEGSPIHGPTFISNDDGSQVYIGEDGRRYVWNGSEWVPED